MSSGSSTMLSDDLAPSLPFKMLSTLSVKIFVVPSGSARVTRTLLPLAVFVAFVQTLVFTLLSMIYISEVSHAPHEEPHDEAHHTEEISGDAAVVHA